MWTLEGFKSMFGYFFNIIHERLNKDIERTSQKEVLKSFESFREIPTQLETNTVNSLISGQHQGNYFCPLIGSVRLLESVIFRTFCRLGRGTSKVLSKGSELLGCWILKFKTKMAILDTCIRIIRHRSKGFK